MHNRMVARGLFKASLFIVSLSITIACASSGGSTGGAASATGSFVPARMRAAPSGVLYMPRFHGSIEVPIDETGRPLTSEMRMIGAASEEARREIASWIERMTFTPATKDGVPVRDVFKIKFK